MGETIEDIPRLYPAPFWAAYGALEGIGVDLAQVRADIAERIVAELVEHAELSAGSASASVRLDNMALRVVVVQMTLETWGRVSTEAVRVAVYAAARVLTVG